MATMEQVRKGLMDYVEKELEPAFAGNMVKQIAVGAGLEFYMRKKLPGLVESLGIAEADGDIDVEMMADVLRRQMQKHPDGLTVELKLNPMNKNDVDVFRFKAEDVERMKEYIMKA